MDESEAEEGRGFRQSDPDFNIQMGAKTFADALSDADGNVLVAIGACESLLPLSWAFYLCR